jgi:hypothetical protein
MREDNQSHQTTTYCHKLTPAKEQKKKKKKQQQQQIP